MENNQDYLEVIINKENEQYSASCPNYPTCKGMGETKESAMKNLSQSISKLVYKQTKSTLDGLFKSSNFSEIILDPHDKKKDFEHRVFHLETKLLPSNRHCVLKYKPTPMPQSKMAQPNNNLLDLLEDWLAQAEEPATKPGYPITRSYSYQLHEGDVLFGIMLCLN